MSEEEQSEYEKNVDEAVSLMNNHWKENEEAFLLAVQIYLKQFDYKKELYETFRYGYHGIELVKHHLLVNISKKDREFLGRLIFAELKRINFVNEICSYRDFVDGDDYNTSMLCIRGIYTPATSITLYSAAPIVDRIKTKNIIFREVELFDFKN